MSLRKLISTLHEQVRSQVSQTLSSEGETRMILLTYSMTGLEWFKYKLKVSRAQPYVVPGSQP